MPWKPTDLSRTDQVRQFYAQRPDLQAFFSDPAAREDLARRMREAGIDVTADDLTDPKVLAELGSVDDPELEKLFPFTQDSIADRKRSYYRKNPGQDPQSTTSRVLEFLGLDEPYYNDSRSYDYAQKKFQNEGNPDMSWFLQPTEAQEQVMSGSMPSVYGAEDDRTGSEMAQGAILGALNWPLFGAEEEVVAGVDALGEGKSYDKALAESRRVKDRHSLHTPLWSQVPEWIASAGLALPVFAGGQAVAARGLSAGRQAAGFAPKATSPTGQAVEEIATASPVAAADASFYQLGEADGDLSQRAEQFDPYWTASVAAFPAILGAANLGRGIVSDGYRKGKELWRRVTGSDKKSKAQPKKSKRLDVAALTKQSGSPFETPQGSPRRPEQPRVIPDIGPVRPPREAPLRPLQPSVQGGSVRGDIERALSSKGRRR
jgi:hypothetical protein